MQKIWALALSILAFFFAFPIQAGIYVSTSKAEMEFNPLLHEMLPRLFRYNILGENNILSLTITAFLGVFLGLYCFSFVFNKTQIDLFHSIPVKRETLFFAKYLAGFISFALPYCFFMSVTLILGLFNGLLTTYSVRLALYMLVLSILMFLLLYSTTIVAVMLTGKLPIAILLDAAFWVLGPLLDTATEQLSQIGFFTYYYREPNSFWCNLSPVYLSFHAILSLESYKTTPHFGVWPVALLLGCGIIMTALSLFIYKKRPSEAAGRSLTFKKSIPFIEIPVLTLGAIFGGLLFNNLTTERGWMFFGLIIVAVIGHMILQAIFHGDFKSIIKCPQWCGISLALALSVTCLFLFDLTGYDKYIPNESKLQSASYSSWDLVGGIEYYNFEAEENRYGNNDYYVDSTEYCLDNIKITDKQLIMDLCKAAVEDSLYAKEMQKQNYYVGSDLEGDRWISLSVAYKFKFMPTVYRDYRINLDKHFDLLNRVYTNENFKEVTYPILSSKKNYDLPMTWQNPVGTTKLSLLSAADKEKLTETYKNELRDLTLYDMEKNVPIGKFYTEFNPDNKDYNRYNIDVAYIYPCFTKTIELLGEYGIDVYDYKRAEDITGIKFQRYSDTGEDEDLVTNFTSRQDIERILELGVPSDYTYINSGLYRLSNSFGIVHYAPESGLSWDINLSFSPENEKLV